MSGLNLIMARLPKHDRLIIGKFRDEVNFGVSNASFQMQEDLEEDVTDVVDEVYSGEKGAEFYKRRRRNRYKRKTQINLEESKKMKDPNSGMRYVGIPVEPKTEGGSASKYVLLQFLKHGDNSVVQVIPVDDWYQFQKANNTKAITLDEVDIHYDTLHKMKSSANKKYQRISKAMEHNSKIYDETIVGKINPGFKAEGDSSKSVSDIFGLAASRMKKGGGGKASSALEPFKGHLTDGGMDADGEKAFEDICGYEYEETRSDDEEDTAIVQQEEMEVAERTGIVDEEEDDEDEEEAEEDEEEKEESTHLVEASRELKGFLVRQSGKDDSDSDKEKDSNLGSSERSSDGIEDRKRSRGDDGQGGEGKRAKTDPPPVPTTSSAQEFELSEDGVRKYLELMGGRIKTKDLAQAFKRQIRDVGSAGKDRFKAIVVKVTIMAEDPVLGKILVMKGK